MITDNETNKLFLADCLPDKQTEFFPRFEKLLTENKIDFQFLPGTKDIWARDFMPVQVSKDKFVQFNYKPDYLQPKKYQKTISDVDSICNAIGLKTIKSELIVDGGNIIRAKDKVIMCDKVFYENTLIPEKDLINELQKLLEVDKLIFVPWAENDFTGHADGMVRFIDDNTVLINDFSNEKTRFQKSFRLALHNAGLDWVELPYNPYGNKLHTQAIGIYINFLQMKDVIVVPAFGIREYEEAAKIIEQVFKGHTIATVESNELARQGGILNCISWNIFI